MGLAFQVVSDQSCSCLYLVCRLRALPGGACISVKADSSVRISGKLAGYIMGWHLLPHFGHSRILLVGFGSSLSVLCFLPGPPVVRQLMQAVIIMTGQG